ncbi:MAG: CbiQ family ECF transporter T component [Protaetiibacter sp.]
MIALFLPGHSLLHRAPAGAKLAGLVVLALLISLWPHTGITIAIAGLLVVGLYALALFPPSVLLGHLWLAKWVVVLMVATQLVFLTPWDALLNTVRVVSIVLLAGLLTLTTRSEALLTALEAALKPFERLGVDARRVGLTLSLTISMLPVVADIARRVREAQQARGVRIGFRAVVPILVLALRHADDVADALSARGAD